MWSFWSFEILVFLDSWVGRVLSLALIANFVCGRRVWSVSIAINLISALLG